MSFDKSGHEDLEGTETPWEVAEYSDVGEAIILGAVGSTKEPDSRVHEQHIVCELPVKEPDNTEESLHVHIDARRIVAAVNFTANLSLEELEKVADDPLPPAEHQES